MPVGLILRNAATAKFSTPRLADISLRSRISCLTRRPSSSATPMIMTSSISHRNSKASRRELSQKNDLRSKEKECISPGTKIQEKLKLDVLKQSLSIEVQSIDERFLLKVKDAILMRLDDEQLSVESLALDVGFSRSQLLRKIRSLTGLKVNELIRTFRLQKAVQLLEQRWGGVSQVAYEVGFSNLSYFSSVFKKECGILPSEYLSKRSDSVDDSLEVPIKPMRFIMDPNVYFKTSSLGSKF
jgi:AraC-like DNA-binding protein